MYGLLIISGFLFWLIVAWAPSFYLIKKRRWTSFRKFGLSWAALIMIIPFWDYVFMVPAIHWAHSQLAKNKVYAVSQTRSIRLVETLNGVEQYGRLHYEEALLKGRLDFIETMVLRHDRETNLMSPTLIRFTREPRPSEACDKSIYKNKHMEFDYCIVFDYVDEPKAEVIIEQGTVFVAPLFFVPEKKYQYSYWRATEIESKKPISEQVNTFIWDPDICNFFNACRYVVDRDWWLLGSSVESSIENISVNQKGD